MTDDEAAYLGWTFEQEVCWCCGALRVVRIPPEHPRVDVGLRPESEHRAAKVANDRMWEQSERQKNRRV